MFGPQNTAGLQSEALWREQLVVLMPGGHPLEGEGALTRNALRNETFLVAGGPSERDLFVALLERTLDGPSPAVRAVPVARETLADMVGLGLGLALTTSSALGAFHPGVAFRLLVDPSASIAFHAIWRRPCGNETVEPFLKAARALADDGRG